MRAPLFTIRHLVALVASVALMAAIADLWDGPRLRHARYTALAEMHRAWIIAAYQVTGRPSPNDRVEWHAGMMAKYYTAAQHPLDPLPPDPPWPPQVGVGTPPAISPVAGPPRQAASPGPAIGRGTGDPPDPTTTPPPGGRLSSRCPRHDNCTCGERPGRGGARQPSGDASLAMSVTMAVTITLGLVVAATWAARNHFRAAGD